MKQRILALAIFILHLSLSASAQKPEVKLFFKKTEAAPGDTLVFGAQVNLEGGPMKMGSLFLKVVNEEGRIWNMRWPVFNGVMSAAVAIPKEFPSSKLDFFFSATTNFFKVTGKLKKPRKLAKLLVMLHTNGLDSENEEVEVAEDRTFQYRYRMFEDQATLLFRKPSGENEDLDVEIETILDSPFAPLANGYQKIYIGDASVKKDKADKDEAIKFDSVVNARAKTLSTVTVTGKKRSPIQEYQELYVNGVFGSQNVRTFDFLEENKNARNITVLDFVKIKAPGIQIRTKPNEDGSIKDATVDWRGSPVLFFIDQFQANFQAMMALPIEDVAMIKLFPPPFAGAKMGNGAGLAIYTKRGNFQGSGPKHNFKVTGYTAPIGTLN